MVDEQQTTTEIHAPSPAMTSIDFNGTDKMAHARMAIQLSSKEKGVQGV